jgi:energy-coupling factor transport system permease protein
MNSVGLYNPTDRWLHHADPRVKLALTLCSMALTLLYQNLWVLAGLFAFHVILFFSSGLPGHQLRNALLALAPVSLLMMLLRWLFYPVGAPLASLGPVALTLGGLAAGAVVALRILILAIAILLWLGTTSNQDVIRSLVSLGLPYAWGLSFSLALRFLPEFFQTYQTIEQAQHARGLDFTNASLLQHIRGRQPILIAMLISSLRKSEQLAIALEARAYGSQGHNRSNYRPLIMKRLDWLILAGILLGFSFMVGLFLGFRFGKQPF